MKAIKFFSITILVLTMLNALYGSSAATLPAKKEIKAKGILVNKTGLESCGWVIQLAKKDSHGHDFLEPMNWSSVKINYKEGQKVQIVYTEDNAKSTCMVGTTVLLKSIKEIK